MHLSDLTTVARLFADPTRGAMLMYLLDGRARPAGELARAAGVSAQTASAHLAQLLTHQVVQVEVEGRHRYYRLAGQEVAELMEKMSTLLPRDPPPPQPLPKQARELAFARSCYNHLAGRLGTAVYAALCESELLAETGEKACVLTAAGTTWFASSFELPPGATIHAEGRQCLDWTERRHHLAGALGSSLLRQLLARNWIRQRADSRAISVTAPGAAALSRLLRIDIRTLQQAD